MVFGSPRSITAFGAALALLFSAGCDEPQSADFGGRPPATVEAVRLDPRPFTDSIGLVGHLEAEESVVIRPEISGVIEEIGFVEGETVAAGEVLFRLRDGEQRADLRSATAGRELARDVYRRTQELSKREVSAVAELDRAVAELEAAEAGVELARVELDRTQIRAPFDGAVGARWVSPGDRVLDTTDLVQIDKIDRLQLLFTLPETAVGLARKGIRLELAIAPFPDERFGGEVYFVSPTLDPNSRRLLLKAWIPNPTGRLRPGQFATLEVEVEHIENALVAPESSIVYDGRGSFVWRVGEGNTAERVDVELGPRADASVVVRSGLRPGDSVVSAGTHKIYPGATLNLRENPQVAAGPPEETQ